jgi:hypothetical protein
MMRDARQQRRIEALELARAYVRSDRRPVMASPEKIAPLIDKLLDAGIDRLTIELVLDRAKAMTVAAVDYALAEVLAEVRTPRLAAYVPEPKVDRDVDAARRIIDEAKAKLHPFAEAG